MDASAAPVESAEDLHRDRLLGSDMVMVTLEPFPTRAEGHGGAVATVAWSSKDDYVATAGADRVVKGWAVQNGGVLLHDLAGHSGPVTGLAFSPDAAGARLATCSEDGSLQVWDWKEGVPVAVYRGQHMGALTCLCWTAEGGGG